MIGRNAMNKWIRLPLHKFEKTIMFGNVEKFFILNHSLNNALRTDFRGEELDRVRTKTTKRCSMERKAPIRYMTISVTRLFKPPFNGPRMTTEERTTPIGVCIASDRCYSLCSLLSISNEKFRPLNIPCTLQPDDFSRATTARFLEPMMANFDPQ